jgi:hypothetical protein
VQILRRLEAGEGTEADLEKLLDISDNILGRSFCALGDGATSPITSSIEYFRDEYLEQLSPRGGCPFDPALDALRIRREPAEAEPPMTETPTRPPRVAAPQTAPRCSEHADFVSRTIDGVRGQRAEGHARSSAAAELWGIQIPRFCDLPAARPGRLLPASALVEIPLTAATGRGMPKPAPGLVHTTTSRRHGRQDRSSLAPSPTRRRRA